MSKRTTKKQDKEATKAAKDEAVTDVPSPALMKKASSSKKGAAAAEPSAPAMSKKSSSVKKGAVEEKALVPIDPHVAGGAAMYSLIQVQGKAQSCYLMFSNVNHNNNKFYIMQCLQSTTSSQSYLFTRYGRVGEVGVISMSPDLDPVKTFKKTFNAKVKKGYQEIQIAAEKPKPQEESKEEVKEAPSTLDASVQNLMSIIFDMKLIEKSV